MGVPQQLAVHEHFSEISADIIAALGALTECSSRLENEPLKGMVGNATATLVGHVEHYCRKLVQLLLSGLGKGESDVVVYDKLWTLRLMGKRSEVTRLWILEAGGLAAVSEAMTGHPGNDKLQKEGTWLVYVLGGLEGITELLRHSRGNPAVQEASAWAIYELAMKQRDRAQAGTAEWPQAETLLLLLLEAMRSQVASVDMLWACCSAIKVMIDSQPCRGSLFIERGGDEAVLQALGVGQAAGASGESLLMAIMQLITSLVQGNASAAQRLRSLGALDGLVACGLRLPGKVTSETMWTLGQVGGVLAVLQVMHRASDSQDAVRSGLAAIAKLTWMPLEDGFQQQLPQAAEALVGLTRNVMAEGPTDDVVYTLQALGGVLNKLTPHVTPGSWPVVDDGVALLVRAVGPSHGELVAQAAIASLGHVADHAPAWRPPLQAVLADLQRRMRSPADREDGIKHQKCVFWTAAVIAGLPVVLGEMRHQPSSPHVQDAAICAIVDVLDEHIEDPASSARESGLEPQQVPRTIEAVMEAMRVHRTHAPVQWSGCNALGLLGAALPPTEDLPAEVVGTVLAALRWHREEHKVASSAFGALRAFLEPRGGRECAASKNNVVRLTEVLRAGDVKSTTLQVLDDFSLTRDTTLVEDAFYTLGLVEGIPAVLQVLVGSSSVCVLLRSGGLKALFELGRMFPDLMAPPRASEVLAVAGAIAGAASSLNEAAGPGDVNAEVVELLRLVELVRGLLGHVSPP